MFKEICFGKVLVKSADITYAKDFPSIKSRKDF